jgi:SNF2 family DNA or RNA helicase
LNFTELDLPFELRPYQEEGVKFLLTSSHGLLADDMGLGKTIQVIAALKHKYTQEGIFKCLIIVPNSLITNWQKEFNVWFPDVPLTLLEGDSANRAILLQRNRGFTLATYDQIRIAYSDQGLRSGNEILQYPEFDIVILDEAQKIKNSNSQTTLACNLIQKKSAWVLTGTPLENNESDIVTLFSFLKRKTIKKGMGLLDIKNIIAPYMLRRLKKEVLTELPELIEQDFFINLSAEQQKEYDMVFDSRREKNPLEVITALKKICNFSENLKSSKLDRLQDVLEELDQKNEKSIVFSQYVKTLEKIDSSLNADNVFLYHGGYNKKEKDDILHNFKNYPGSAVLLMSLQAGSVGLNLQEASTVILFDRWWNPAVENQAIARAHRMGRTEPVHAIKFIIQNTIEERINQLLQEKSDIFDDVIEGAVEVRNKLKLNEILEI